MIARLAEAARVRHDGGMKSTLGAVDAAERRITEHLIEEQKKVESGGPRKSTLELVQDTFDLLRKELIGSPPKP